jgi:hypothetical protein
LILKYNVCPNDFFKGSKEQLNICYTQPQTNWLSRQENNDTFELVIKKDTTSVKNFASNNIKNQQQTVTVCIFLNNNKFSMCTLMYQ